LVAAALYVAVNNLEPNRSHASALKILIITLAVVAILSCGGNPRSFDGVIGGRSLLEFTLNHQTRIAVRPLVVCNRIQHS
jgi:hypothetical protein